MEGAIDRCGFFRLEILCTFEDEAKRRAIEDSDTCETYTDFFRSINDLNGNANDVCRIIGRSSIFIFRIASGLRKDCSVNFFAYFITRGRECVRVLNMNTNAF